MTIAIIYLMTKYQWSIEETLTFINTKKKELLLGEKYHKLLVTFTKSSNRHKLYQIFKEQPTE